MGKRWGSSAGRDGEVCGSVGLVPGTPALAKHPPSCILSGQGESQCVDALRRVFR